MNRLPPGPSGLAARRLGHPSLSPDVRDLRCLAARYGDPFRIGYSAGAVTFTGDPAALRTAYSASPECFEVASTNVIAPVFGTTSLVVSSGGRHRRDRKLVAAAFSPSSMRRHGETIARIAEAAASAMCCQPGHSFSMLEAMRGVALDVVIRVVFGIEDAARDRATRAAVLALIESFHPLIFMFPALRRDFGGIGPWAKLRRARAALDALLVEEIDARRATLDDRTDVLGLLLAAHDEDGASMPLDSVQDHLRALLFAGHETTATALAWAFFLIHRDRDALARARAEVDALGRNPGPDALASLPFLEAVCLETLRLYPPVVDPARRTRAPFELAGYAVPAGEAVRPSIQLAHARPEIYPEPERFRPERFLDRKYSPFEYLAFGGGDRRCVGAAFALYEMKIVLGTLLGRHRFALESAAPVEHVRRSLTMGPGSAIQMRVER